MSYEDENTPAVDPAVDQANPADTTGSEEAAGTEAAGEGAGSADADSAADDVTTATIGEPPVHYEIEDYPYLSGRSMLGELTQAFVDEIKAQRDPWPKLSPREQDDAIARCEKRARWLIGQIVNQVATEERVVIAADLDSMTAKDEIKAVLKIQKSDPQRHQLLDCVGRAVLIVVAGVEDFMGGNLPKPDERPDPQLDLYAEGVPEGEQGAPEPIAVDGQPEPPADSAQNEAGEAREEGGATPAAVDAPEGWQRDDARTIDATMLVPELELGVAVEPELVALWTDADCAAVERWAQDLHDAMQIGADTREIRARKPLVLTGLTEAQHDALESAKAAKVRAAGKKPTAVK